MTRRQMPMPENPTWFDEVQAALFPWFGTPEGWEPYLQRRDIAYGEPEAGAS